MQYTINSPKLAALALMAALLSFSTTPAQAQVIYNLKFPCSLTGSIYSPETGGHISSLNLSGPGVAAGNPDGLWITNSFATAQEAKSALEDSIRNACNGSFYQLIKCSSIDALVHVQSESNPDHYDNFILKQGCASTAISR